MPWNTIASSDVLDELSPQEASSFNTLQNQSTTQGSILTRVVNQVRGYVAASGRPLDAAGTIPDQLRNEVIDIVLWRWLKKWPQLKALQTDTRKDAYKAAMEMLKEVSKKDSDIYIELPASAQTAAPSPVTLPSVSVKHHSFTRRSEDGI